MAKHKTNKGSIALAVAITAVVMAGIIAFLVCTDCFTNWNKYCQWGHDYDEYGICKRNPDHVKPAEKDDDAEYFQIASEKNGQNVISLAQINKSAYSAMGISASVESAYTLTATIAPANADNQRIVWTVEFVNSNSEWAQKNNPSDYVKVQPTVDGSNVATVTCLKAFGEQINVIATSVDNEASMASCLCDYVKRIVGMDLNISSDTLEFGSSYSVEATPQYGVGTIEGDYNISGYKLELVSEIGSALHGLEYKHSSGAVATYSTSYNSINRYYNVNINSDIIAQTFSFAGSDPFYTFGTYKTSGTTSKASAAISGLKSLVNNTFKEKVNSISGPHMTFTFKFEYTYEGKSYVETTAKADLKFDAETLAIHVISIELDNDHIVFMSPSNSVIA